MFIVEAKWLLGSDIIRALIKLGKSIRSVEKTDVEKMKVHKVHKMEVFNFFPVQYVILAEKGREIKVVI